MTGTCCFAPLPSRMEAFTTRLCDRAYYQYEKLVELNRSKKTGEKNVDVNDLWRPNAAKNDSTHHLFNNSFKRWKRKESSSSSKQKDNCQIPTTEEDGSLLKFLALNALDLTVPASDVLKRRHTSWFQLSGHPDCFAPAGPGTIWKKRSNSPDDCERDVYEALSNEPAFRGIIPKYYREVEYQGEKFIELQDLLHDFHDPNVIDIKMGTRTFLESEVEKSAARNDLYHKMVSVDSNAPTAEEHAQQAVTKLRYMQFREQQSSTCSQGFRIEAMKFRGSPPVTDLKKVKSRDEVLGVLSLFLGNQEETKESLVNRLLEIKTKFEQSAYFSNHEIVGSSIFMIYDDSKVGAWIIDFAKTCALPDGQTVTHRNPWIQGNHEEGFLFGLDSLISIMNEIDLSKDYSCSSSISKTPVHSLKS